MVVSSEYINQYQKLHAQDPMMFSGQQTLYVKNAIKKIINHYGCKTMLDYGCGKGLQYTLEKANADWGVEIFLFDIGVKEFSIKPSGIFDLVSSTDMLEHCEEGDIKEILKELDSYSNKIVLVSISTRLARKTLPDGRNAHLTVKPSDWWIEQIRSVATKPWIALFEGEGENALSGDRKSRAFDIKTVGEITLNLAGIFD